MSRRFGMGHLFKTRTAAGVSVWVAKWTDATGRRRRQILSTDRIVAERRYRKLLRDRDLEVAGLACEQAQDKLVADLVADYLAHLASFRRPRYVRSVRLHLDALMADFGDAVRVRDVSVDRLLVRRGQRLGQGLSHRTINAEANAMKTFLNWCVATGRVGANPLSRLKPLPTTEADQVKRRRALSDEDLAALLNAAAADDHDRTARFAATRTIASGVLGKQYAARPRITPIPQRPFFLAAIAFGCRYGELASMTWADLNLDDAIATVRAANAKSRRSRQVPIPPYVVEELKHLREIHAAALGRVPGPTDYAFLSPKHRPLDAHGNPMRVLLRRNLERAGIDYRNEDGTVAVDIHSLRGSAATRLLRHAVPLAIVAEVLGHSDPRLTMRHYAGLRINDTKRAVEGVPALGSATPIPERQLAAEDMQAGALHQRAR